jgi:hypothetical protein
VLFGVGGDLGERVSHFERGAGSSFRIARQHAGDEPLERRGKVGDELR